MIQGGDPTGTGKGGQSIYGKHFQDELVDELTVRTLVDIYVRAALTPDSTTHAV